MDEAEEPCPCCCPECGAVMTSNRLDGICPVCLLDETDATAAGTTKNREEPTGPQLLKLRGHRIIREIARGGMGIIYEAEQTEPRRRVAVKMLLPHLLEDPGMRERFRIEVQAMAGLDHSGILPVYEVGDCNGLPFFTMKLASGGNLAKNAERFRGNWRAIAALTAHLADAIQTAHEYGLLHRDLKPANILFDEKDRASVSDFGIAKRLDDGEGHHHLTKSESLIGTPNYLPPEWASGTAKRPTTAGDIYGLGAILYELLAGRPPHQDKHLTALLRQIADEPVKPPRTLNPKIPRDLEIICLKAIRKEPTQRYASASALAADLRNWLTGRPVQARSVTRGEKVWRWALRNPLPSTLAVLLGLALTVGGAALWQALRTSRQHLHDALLAQASAMRENASLENQDEVLSALRQAADIDPSPAVREEYVSALSMTSFEEVRSIRYGMHDVTNRVHTDAGLTCYTHRDATGGLTIRRMDNSAIISSVGATGLSPDNYGPVSPDGKYLIVRPVKPAKSENPVAQDTPLYIWDIPGGSWVEKELLGFYGCFSPDGRTMAISSVDGTVSFLDLVNGDRRGPFTTCFTLQARPYAFSPDGSKLLIGQVGNPPQEKSLHVIFKSLQTTFMVMDVGTGGEILRNKNPSGASMRCVAWRPDSQSFFVGSENFRIYEWQMNPGSLPRQYVGHQGSITVMEVNGNGDMLLSQAEDKTTRLWNTGSGQPVATLSCTGSEARFSPNGDRFVCEDRDVRQLREFRLDRSDICREFPIFHPLEGGTSSIGCYTLLFSPDGGLLTVGDLAGQLHFDGFTGAPLGRSRPDPCWSMQWSPEGNRLYSSSKLGLHLRSVIRTEDGVSVLQPVRDDDAWIGPGNERTLNHCSLRQDGRALLMGRRHWLEVYDTSTGRVKSRMDPIGDRPKDEKPSRGGIDVSRINQNGTLAALSQEDYCDVLIWDLAAGRQLGKITTRFPEAAVLFGRDPDTLYIGTQDEVGCWDARTLQNRWRLAVHPKLPMPAQLAFSGDFSVLAATLTPDSVSLLSPQTKEEIIRLRHASPHPINSLALSPDGTRLAVFCLGHMVQLWDLARLRTLLAERKLDWSGPQAKVSPPHRWRILPEPE